MIPVEFNSGTPRERPMEIVYLLVPLALVIAGLVVWLFFWAIRTGQFDDLEGPAHRILMDDERPADNKGEAATGAEQSGGTKHGQ